VGFGSEAAARCLKASLGAGEGWGFGRRWQPARLLAAGLQGLFITLEETFELKSGLEGRAGSAVAGGNVAFAPDGVP